MVIYIDMDKSKRHGSNYRIYNYNIIFNIAPKINVSKLVTQLSLTTDQFHLKLNFH